MTINTSEGPKTPDEALAIFKNAKMPTGSLLGIFNQLEGFPQFKEARVHVLANAGLYNEKLQRIAKEKSTGRPLCAKVINDESDLTNFLWGCGLCARVAITVRKEKARSISALLTLGNLNVDDMSKTGLMAVAMSGEWQSVPRTFTATLSLTSNEMIPITHDALFGIVEKMELMSTLTERVKAYTAPMPLSDEVKAILATDPELFYDRSLFLEVCDEREFGNQKERVGELSDTSTMEDVMMLFFGNLSREEFLEYYIARFTAALA